MLKIFKEWNLLKDKLTESDPKVLEKNVGINRTIVVCLKNIVYDTEIPILSDEHLENWMECRKNGQKYRIKSKSTSKSKSKSKTKSHKIDELHIDKHKKYNQSIKDREDEEEKEGQSEGEFNQETPLVETRNEQQNNLNDLEDYEDSEDSENDDNCIDKFVYGMEEEDEFAKYKDDNEFEETTISKNLKKIRATEIPKQNNKNSKNNLENDKKALSPVKTSNYFSNNYNHDSRNSPEKRNHNSDLLPPPTPPPEDKEPAKPNWEETIKYIQQNQLEIAFRDLNHFKEFISSDVLAKPLLLELVKKCLDVDETCLLAESLKLIYQLGLYLDDYEFWSMLLLKLKRKLLVHSNVKNLFFKSKANPLQIHENYKKIALDFSEYYNTSGLKLLLDCQSARFAIEPLKFLEPESKKPSIDVKPKIENKQEANKSLEENHNPCENRTINISRTNPMINSDNILNPPISNIENNINTTHVQSTSSMQSNMPTMSGYQQNSTNDHDYRVNLANNLQENNNANNVENVCRKVTSIRNKFGKEGFKVTFRHRNKQSLSTPSTSLLAYNNGKVIFNKKL